MKLLSKLWNWLSADAPPVKEKLREKKPEISISYVEMETENGIDYLVDPETKKRLGRVTQPEKKAEIKVPITKPKEEMTITFVEQITGEDGQEYLFDPETKKVVGRICKKE